ncbi:MAG TPA: gamma-glutamylcyclotransferase family protein [Candidatus Bathyarchaeia archaeon]|nr:gamma-glutamylcyclotransferase family protein [Candidatus Bathyarchaeia archaeon]
MSAPPTPRASVELLFSYGTLQLDAVQLSTFGRRLTGHADALPGYERALVEIEDPAVVATSGKTHHPIVRYTGRATDRVEGTVFEITGEELERADAYEVAAYRRMAETLGSGVVAWVYVDARHARPS